MTQISEEEYEDKLVKTLKDRFSGDSVDVQVELDSGRTLDILIKRDDAKDIAIEVENDWESVYTGYGQIQGYAREIGAKPVVAVPPTHVEMPEVIYMNDGEVSVIQMPTDDIE